MQAPYGTTDLLAPPPRKTGQDRTCDCRSKAKLATDFMGEDSLSCRFWFCVNPIMVQTHNRQGSICSEQETIDLGQDRNLSYSSARSSEPKLNKLLINWRHVPSVIWFYARSHLSEFPGCRYIDSWLALVPLWRFSKQKADQQCLDWLWLAPFPSPRRALTLHYCILSLQWSEMLKQLRKKTLLC